MFNRFRPRFGLLGKDPKDPRDFLLAAVQPVAVPLPDEFDLRNQQSEVQNQDGLGICYSFAIAGIGEYWNTKEYHQPINLSERFIVHFTKKISGMWGEQADFFRNALKAFCDNGAPLETDYPFSPNWEDYKIEPPEDIIKKALEFRGKTYWRVNPDLESLRQAVYQNQCPVLVGMPWYESYNRPERDGKLPLPSGKIVGGHAVSGGYWTREKVWFKNSWGSGWGLNGYFYIPFNEFSMRPYWDFWILLDLPKPSEIKEGWVADKYIERTKSIKFVPGDEVITTTRLKLRANPGTESEVLEILEPDTKLVIVPDEKNGQKVGYYYWFKVKKI